MKSEWPSPKNWPVIKRNIIWSIAPAVLFGIVYLYTKNQIFSFDGLTNAIACEAGEPIRWFHPNHIFYPFLGVGWFHMESMFGIAGTSLYSLARFNSFITLVGLAFFVFQFQNYLKTRQAFFVGLFLYSTYSVWHYSTDGRAIGAATGLILLLVSYVTTLLHKIKLG